MLRPFRALNILLGIYLTICLFVGYQSLGLSPWWMTLPVGVLLVPEIVIFIKAKQSHRNILLPITKPHHKKARILSLAAIFFGVSVLITTCNPVHKIHDITKIQRTLISKDISQERIGLLIVMPEYKVKAARNACDALVAAKEAAATILEYQKAMKSGASPSEYEKRISDLKDRTHSLHATVNELSQQQIVFAFKIVSVAGLTVFSDRVYNETPQRARKWLSQKRKR